MFFMYFDNFHITKLIDIYDQSFFLNFHLIEESRVKLRYSCFKYVYLMISFFEYISFIDVKFS